MEPVSYFQKKRHPKCWKTLYRIYKKVMIEDISSTNKIFLEVRGFFYTITKSKVYCFMVMTLHHPSKHQDLRSCYCPVLVKMLGSET